MKVKAMTAFAGINSMRKDEVRDVDEKEFEELLKLGYVKKVETKKATKKK